jgi:hypothetical protein
VTRDVIRFAIHFSSRNLYMFRGLTSMHGDRGRKRLFRMVMSNLDLQAKIANKLRLPAGRTGKAASSHKDKQKAGTEFITSTPIEGVVAFACIHVSEVIHLAQRFQLLRGLMAKSQTQNIFVLNVTGKPIAALEINIHRADFFSDFKGQQEIWAWVHKAAPYRIGGVAEFEARIGGKVPTLSLKKSPFHRDLGISQPALQRLPLIAYQQIRDLIIQLDARAQAIVQIQNWRGIRMKIGRSIQGVTEIDLPVSIPRRARIIREKWRPSLSDGEDRTDTDRWQQKETCEKRFREKRRRNDPSRHDEILHSSVSEPFQANHIESWHSSPALYILSHS